MRINDKQITEPKTLLELAGIDSKPNRLAESVLVIIDAQKEFSEGKLKLFRLKPAIKEAGKILDRARYLDIPVIHVKHYNKSGARLFNPDLEFVESFETLKPKPDETIIIKGFANAFFNSTLDDEIQRTGRKDLVIFGYMTHMAVDATVRTAIEFGYRTTVIGDACATRDLSDGYGNVISAVQIHNAALAALRDRFAVVIKSENELEN